MMIGIYYIFILKINNHGDIIKIQFSENVKEKNQIKFLTVLNKLLT